MWVSKSVSQEAELLCSHLRVLQEGLPPRGPREPALRLWGRQQLLARSCSLGRWEGQDGWSELGFGSRWFISPLWTARSADTHRDPGPRGMVQRVWPLNHCAFNRPRQTERRGRTRHLHSHGGKRKRESELTSSCNASTPCTPSQSFTLKWKEEVKYLSVISLRT